MIHIASPHRLRIDASALVSNWRWLARTSGSATCGAAIKADGYGLGAREVMAHLTAVGCRDFFVATWAEAAALMPLPEGVSLSVLHGVDADDMRAARLLPVRPVLNSVEQVLRWRMAGEGKACDVMIDTGMNRLGLSMAEVMGGALTGLTIETLMSHLACADEDNVMNGQQLAVFQAVRAQVPARRYSLANSAGICLGPDYHFDLTRPGLALYGGVPRAEAADALSQTAFPEARIIQVRDVPAGGAVGYGATWIAKRASRIAIINMGYADGYVGRHTGHGSATWMGQHVPLVGRVSMDMLAFDVSEATDVEEGGWLTIAYDLPATSRQSGVSQYELLTGIGPRVERYWV